MKFQKFAQPFVIALVLISIMLGCSSPPAEPTMTPETPTPAFTATSGATRFPTFTPRPTRTPDLAATQQVDDFNLLLEDYSEKGYIPSTAGSTVELDPFNESWAQIGWFQWWPYDVTGADFVFKGHFSWSTASETPDDSGCGVVFGLQENGDYYAVFVDYSSILFRMKRGSYLYGVGKTSGTGKTDFTNPAEADVVLAVANQKAFLSVNDQITEYTLSVDQTSAGGFALSMLSGTNRDYGTQCEITNMFLWKGK